MWTRWSVGHRPKGHRSCSVKGVLLGLGIETGSVPDFSSEKPQLPNGDFRPPEVLSRKASWSGAAVLSSLSSLLNAHTKKKGGLSDRLPLSLAIGDLQPVSGCLRSPRGLLVSTPFQSRPPTAAPKSHRDSYCENRCTRCHFGSEQSLGEYLKDAKRAFPRSRRGGERHFAILLLLRAFKDHLGCERGSQGLARSAPSSGSGGVLRTVRPSSRTCA